MTSPVVSECCHARTGASIELGAPPVAPLLCCALRWPHLCLGTSVILVGMAKDGMKRLAATARGGRSPTVVHAVVCRKRWRPAMEHLGIDVHKVESQICILTESGKVVERRIRTQRERFAAVLGERPRARILIEASTESEWVARCLEELGHEVVVADPNFAAMYATRSRKVKTDLRDARTLAEACKLGAYRAAHRTSDRQRHVRAQLSVREALVQTRARYISLIGALLRREGLRIASGAAEGFAKRVARLALPGQLKSEIAPLLAVFVSVDRQLAWIDTRLEHLARTDETVERLCSARTEALRKWATGIAVRRGKKIAIVALARRMAGVLFAMMRDRTCYLQPALLAPAAQVA